MDDVNRSARSFLQEVHTYVQRFGWPPATGRSSAWLLFRMLPQLHSLTGGARAFFRNLFSFFCARVRGIRSPPYFSPVPTGRALLHGAAHSYSYAPLPYAGRDLFVAFLASVVCLSFHPQAFLYRHAESTDPRFSCARPSMRAWKRAQASRKINELRCAWFTEISRSSLNLSDA